EMLQGMTCASPPALAMPSATSLQASALREEITTLAPSCASSSAQARPMPRLEPVMTATWPVRSKGGFLIRCLRVPWWSKRTSPPRHPGAPGRGEPGTHNHRLGLWIPGLRASHASRNDDGERALPQPAGVGDAAQMIVGVAKGVLDHGQPLEIVADLGLLRHADAAVQLDRLLADELSGFADLHFCGGDRGCALPGIVEIPRHGRA